MEYQKGEGRKLEHRHAQKEAMMPENDPHLHVTWARLTERSEAASFRIASSRASAEASSLFRRSNSAWRGVISVIGVMVTIKWPPAR